MLDSVCPTVQWLDSVGQTVYWFDSVFFIFQPLTVMCCLTAHFHKANIYGGQLNVMCSILPTIGKCIFPPKKLFNYEFPPTIFFKYTSLVF